MLPAPPPRQPSEDVNEPVALASQRITAYADGTAARPSNLAQPLSPRTVRQKLQFGADSQSGRRGAGWDAAAAADAAASAHLTYAARQSALDQRTSVTPSAGHADGADGLSLRQPSGAAAESPTQTKLRSLLKVRDDVVMLTRTCLSACVTECTVLSNGLAQLKPCAVLPYAGTRSTRTVCLPR